MRIVSFKEHPCWGLINAGLVMLSISMGYGEMSPERLQHSNPNFFFCLAVFVVMTIFVVGSIQVSKSPLLRKPGWNRFPLNWSRDTLQALFVATWCTLGIVVGSLLAVRGSGTVGLWSIAFYSSILLGLVAGQAIVYTAYRDGTKGVRA